MRWLDGITDLMDMSLSKLWVQSVWIEAGGSAFLTIFQEMLLLAIKLYLE